MRPERFTERAQDAIARAQEILQQLQHTQLDTEHLLLALLEQPEGLVPQILQKLGVDLELLRRRVQEALLASGVRLVYPYGLGGLGLAKPAASSTSWQRRLPIRGRAPVGR